ncbi:MAG: hypothetical protein KDD43_08405, partial [Bdellovibrionales bacterium]|nr:hypothetical protein [Bdellovibrionales bacterium]
MSLLSIKSQAEVSESSPKSRTNPSKTGSKSQILDSIPRLENLVAFSLFLLVTGATTSALGQQRISSLFFDRSTVGQLFIKPGLSTAVQFPCNIDEVKVGLKESLETSVSKTLKSELVISARSSLSQITNLIVRCMAGVFVFDVIPSKENHQDYVKILGGTGGPKFEVSQNREGNRSESLGEGLKKTAQEVPQ